MLTLVEAVRAMAMKGMGIDWDRVHPPLFKHGSVMIEMFKDWYPEEDIPELWSENVEVTGKIGAAIFSPGDQWNCAVRIVLEGQDANDAYNVSSYSDIWVSDRSITGSDGEPVTVRGLLEWLSGVKHQVTAMMTVDGNRDVVKGSFQEVR